MQAHKVTQDLLFSESFNLHMLLELATKYLGMTDEGARQIANEPLTKGSKDLKKLMYAKLRTVLATKLSNSPAEEYGELYKNGELELDFECLQPAQPEPDINNAGANKGASKNNTKKDTGEYAGMVLKGAYQVLKRGLKAQADDPKWEIWNHIFGCTQFEDVYAKAPAKVVKRGRDGQDGKSICTPTSELRWALKQGWIKPV